MSAAASPEIIARREEALYALLCETARKGAVCPIGDELAHAVGAPTTTTYALLKRLERAGLISITVHHARGAPGTSNVYRVIRIVATGETTGHPVRGKSMRQAGEATELDRAKTFLRSRGPVVYDRSVVTGGPRDLLIQVDRHVFTPDEVIALAVRIRLGSAPHGECSGGCSRPLGSEQMTVSP